MPAARGGEEERRPRDDVRRTQPIVAIVGATATGKSELALRLALALDGEIVNADALQVYRGLDVGTAKPCGAMRAAVRHHLLDVLEPTERFSAGEFARRARQAIDEIHGRGRPAFVVGGSGLYLRALTEGLSPLPRTDPKMRKGLEKRLEQEGLAALYEELGRVDPETASRLAPGDRQRILRALEVHLLSGRPLSRWHRDQPLGASPLEVVKMGLTMPRSILYDRIGTRVETMMERGWIAEVVGLLSRGVTSEAPAFQAIGYRQLVRVVLAGESLEAALSEIIQATRRYAKRQETWFRREEGVQWIPALDAERYVPAFVEQLAESSALWCTD